MTHLHDMHEEMGILYSAVCGHCGHCIDDHDDPERYGIEEWLQKERKEGFRTSLYSCRGFRIRKVDMNDIVYVNARRLFFGEGIPTEFWNNPGICRKSENLLKEKEATWQLEPFNNRSTNYGSVMCIGNYMGVPFAFDIGTA